ncbi:hypothetical protein ACXYTJ_13140 [Gilvimarinus sp. F26214L]|uniref:hypothetical protein n=1 Tax=Gilvimarinus sp. DZF01 TaxID=3461371 RepID=UPI0040466BFE
MRRILFLTHRYLGIALGLVMLMWCLSGFVMMYVPYPSFDDRDAVTGLPVLDLGSCCETSAIPSLRLVDVHRFTLEMLGDRPVVRIQASGGQQPMLDLVSGEVLDTVGPERARIAAEAFGRNRGIQGDLASMSEIELDQWTVSAYFDSERPLYKFAATDPQRSEWYISSRTGEVMQLTQGSQRFWNWLGAVPHWLYPTLLRQHDDLWSAVVIWLSLGGAFLTLVGLYIGVVQFRTRRSGRKSPYRGIALWHHYAGLFFGVFILTWVASGFVSMNPWGVFDFGGGAGARQRLQGVPLYSGELERFLQELPEAPLPEDTVRVEGYALGGKLYYLAHRRTGAPVRYEGRTHREAPLGADEWKRLAATAAGGASVAEAGMLTEEDAYHYQGHDSDGRLPVYRVILADDSRTHVYLDAQSGELVAWFDQPQKVYRWLFAGLHRLDFPAWLRARPGWDLLVWFLMLGVTVSTASGTWMGLRRLLR